MSSSNLQSLSARLDRSRPRGAFSIILLIALGSAALEWGASASRAEEPADPQHVRWPEFLEIALFGGETSSPWFDLLLPAEVFGRARLDLGDLRLIDAAGDEIPYALRVREAKYSQQDLKADEFNRATVGEETSELTLDLGAEPAEHNEVELDLPGEGFRRHVLLEASDDASEWRKLAEKNLFYFRSGDHELHDLRLSYPPSRFRYLRLRVDRDTNVDHDPVKIVAATVRRRVELPGEYLAVDATLGMREAVRAAAGPGSAWMIDLGVDQLPCEKIELEVADQEFARDYLIEAGGPPESDRGFVVVAQGQWSRKAGERSQRLVAEFPEQRCARLRLIVTDYSNPPLNLMTCRVSGSAREIVLEHTPSLRGPLRLYYGNLNAEPPHYDIERNLPARLEPEPVRLAPGPPQGNPDYVPEPEPFTERWPWLVDLVLALAGVALAAIIVSLGRTAIARADAVEAAPDAGARENQNSAAKA